MDTKNKTSNGNFNATSHKTDVIGSRFKPILFSTPMVQAILDGRKSQMRRIVKPMRGMQSEWLSMDLINKVKEGQIVKGGWQMFHPNGGEKSPLGWIKSNYQIGDILWVRETWQQECELIQIAGGDWSNAYLNATGNYVYKSDNIILPSETETFSKWKPSIFMPKEACRIFLKVTNMRVERLNDISEGDAISEGIISKNEKLFLIMKTKLFIIYLHKILSNHFGILSIKIGKKIPLFGFTPLNGLSVHTISDNVRGLCVRAGFEKPKFNLSTDDK